MELLLKNSPNSYESGDLVTTYPDGTDYTGSQEANTDKFTIVTGVILSNSDIELLQLVHNVFKNTSSLSNIAAFRHTIFNRNAITYVKRRKYYYDNGSVVLK